MAKSWQYPRWRRIAMQLVMWLVLAGTIGLAALVDQKRQRARLPTLATAVTYGDLTIQLPKRWQVTQGTEDQPLLVVRATEGVANGDRDDFADEDSMIASGARVISIYREHTGTLVSPTEYLSRAGASLGVMGGDSSARGAARAMMLRTTSQKSDQTRVAGQVGALVARVHAVAMPGAGGGAGDEGDGNGAGFRVKEILASTVLPTREAITVALVGTGAIDPADEQLVRRIAAAMTVKDLPIASSSSSSNSSGDAVVELYGGTRVAMPDGFRDVSLDDPNATHCQLLSDTSLADWTALDLVPCAFLTSADDDAPTAILSMLAMRDPAWRTAAVTSDAPGSYRIERRADDTQPFASRAYLIADKSGHGLLGIFRSGGRDGRRFDAAWESIVKGVVFPQTSEFDAMLAAGAAETKRLGAAGLDQLLGDARDDEWWLWYRETPEHYLGWSNVRYDRGSRWSGNRESRWRTDSRALIRFLQTWDMASDLSSYGAKVVRAEAGPGQTQAFANVFEQIVTLRRGQVSIRSSTPAGSAVKLAPNVANATTPAPPQFVPGAVLPSLLGRLSVDHPLILRTDSFVSYEGDAGPGLLTLLIRAAADDATHHSAADEAPSPPRRCVTVEVNGSGEISRWYFPTASTTAAATDAPAAERLPESVDFSEHLHGVRSDLQQIRLGFSEDARMVP